MTDNTITSRHIIDIVKYRFVWLCISAILLLPGTVSLIYSAIHNENHVPLKVGIDYTGGTILQYGVNKNITNDDITKTRESLEDVGIENPYIQVLKANNEGKNGLTNIVSIRTKFVGQDEDTVDKITETLSKDYDSPELISVSLAFLGIIAYLSFRFKFDYALAAILGIAHDVLFVVGVFSLLGIFYNVQIDGLFITAILTVVGFSVHDTIVVFDRIRENLRYYSKKMSFGEIVNASVNQTLARSINTSLTTLITLGALYFFGGVTTKDFVLAMILGIAIGTYSSIFFCSVLVDIWEDKKNNKTPATKSPAAV